MDQFFKHLAGTNFANEAVPNILCQLIFKDYASSDFSQELISADY